MPSSQHHFLPAESKDRELLRIDDVARGLTISSDIKVYALLDGLDWYLYETELVYLLLP
jgi:hypothetical protein